VNLETFDSSKSNLFFGVYRSEERRAVAELTLARAKSTAGGFLRVCLQVLRVRNQSPILPQDFRKRDEEALFGFLCELSAGNEDLDLERIRPDVLA